MTSGPFSKIKWASDSFATAFANNVLPVPGGPYNRTPFGGSIPSFENISGLFRGSSTISRTFLTSSVSPPMSSYVICGIDSSEISTAFGFRVICVFSVMMTG